VSTLQRGRLLAEEAGERLKLTKIPGALIALGMVVPGEIFVARTVVANAQEGPVDLGNTHVPWAALYGALAYGVNGWTAFRVAPGGRVVAPTVADLHEVRYALTMLGYDYSRAPHEQQEQTRGG
jgi:hypothetical protein